jgi:hypothetical protein
MANGIGRSAQELGGEVTGGGSADYDLTPVPSSGGVSLDG